jgi:predicted AlkP superfamily pyrophosphatase or phosphodiesterase
VARRSVRTSTVVAIALVLGALSLAAPAAASSPRQAQVRHVVLLSIDGLHQADLAWYVARHPGSSLAGLVGSGAEFTRAQTPVPSDSFPGLIAQVTGGNPKSTGIYYDDS